MKPIKVVSWYDYLRKHPTFTGCLINKDSDISWYKDGVVHREDGPAVERSYGGKAWWLNGRGYSEQQWLIVVRKIKLEKVLKNING